MSRSGVLFAAAAIFVLATGGSSSGGSSSAMIAAGGSHTCLLSNGAVSCWGDNSLGEVGDGTTTTRLVPTAVSGLSSRVRAISTGGFHSCALLSDGSVTCWGAQLGGLGLNFTPVAVPGLAGVRAISVGGTHACALLDGGGVKCWGENNAGQLGDGTTTDRAVPVAVSGLSSGVTAISAGFQYSCAVLGTGALECWGANGDGQLGDGTQANRLTPAPVANLRSGVQAVAPNSDHTCALLSGGGVECWGDNLAGALGDGTENDHYTPVPVSGLSSGVQAIASGGDELGFTCALLDGGSVKCWGESDRNQVGDGKSVESRSRPVAVVGLVSGAQAIAAGDNHACALLPDGSVKCWGSNRFGQFGNGTRTFDLTVDLVGGGTAIVPGRYLCSALGDATECTLERTQGTRIVVTARPAKGWRFKAWAPRDPLGDPSKACKGRAPRCTVVLKANATATARFVRRQSRR